MIIMIIAIAKGKDGHVHPVSPIRIVLPRDARLPPHQVERVVLSLTGPGVEARGVVLSPVLALFREAIGGDGGSAHGCWLRVLCED